MGAIAAAVSPKVLAGMNAAPWSTMPVFSTSLRDQLVIQPFHFQSICRQRHSKACALARRITEGRARTGRQCLQQQYIAFHAACTSLERSWRLRLFVALRLIVGAISYSSFEHRMLRNLWKSSCCTTKAIAPMSMMEAKPDVRKIISEAPVKP